MAKPRALDLFSGAGGASRGLHAAGFDVTGIDIEPQPNYPYAFIRADALEFPLGDFDFFWASPKCQAFCAYKRRAGHVRPAENQIPKIRERLLATGRRFAIENVVGARAPSFAIRSFCAARCSASTYSAIA